MDDDPMDDACCKPPTPKDPPPPPPPVNLDEARFYTLFMTRPVDFDSWTSAIAEIEKKSPVEEEKLFLAYDSFLSEFPLCYGYWRKYANHKARLCSMDTVVEVYERAVQSATYSVDLWVDYCSFGMLLFEDPTDVRRLFERGISFVGKDYLCYLLWDKYIEFEYSQKQWSFLARIYIRTLMYPTKKLGSYYDSFQKLATFWGEEIKVQGSELQSKATPNVNVTDTAVYDEEISLVIRDILDPAGGLRRNKSLQKYLSTGEKLYQNACHLDAKICCFENHLRRFYFHVKPLDDGQLENWHQYLDFVEVQGDFDWTVKLYERCLIPCAAYPEFWMRYVECMETKGARELANFALVRATQIFVKRVSAVHLFCARFKEKIGDVFGSHASFRHCDSDLDSDFIENVRREANMERRLGNPEAAFNIYEKAIALARKRQKSYTVSVLYVQFSRFKYMVTGYVSAARDVLYKGIQHFPHCKILLEGLLNFEMMHRGPKQMNFVDSIIAHAISPGKDLYQGLSSKDREDISNLYLEFLEYCGTIEDIMKAWNRHIKLFPHLTRPASYNNTTGKQNMDIALPHCPANEYFHGLAQPLELHQKSMLSENPNIKPDQAITVGSLLEDTDSPNDTAKPLASPKVIEQPRHDPTPVSGETNNIMNEVSNDHSALNAAIENLEGTNSVQRKTDKKPNNELGPPSLENLSLSSQDGVSHDSAPSASYYCEISHENPRRNGSRQQNVDKHSSVSSLSCLTTCPESDSSMQLQCQSDYGPPRLPTDPPSLQTQVPSHPLIPGSSSPDGNIISGGELDPVNYTGQALGDSSNESHGDCPHQSKEFPGPPEQQYQSSAMHSQIHMTQSYYSQHQSLQIPPVQPDNQAPNRFQVAAAPVQPLSSLNQSLQNPSVQPGNQAPNQYQMAAAQMQPQSLVNQYSQNALMQPCSQAPNQFHVAVAQVQPLSLLVRPALNLQQQYFASAAQPQPQPQLNSQPVSYPQVQPYQYLLQSNIQYAHEHGNRAIDPQMWYYYYQQQPPQLQQQGQGEQNQPPPVQQQQQQWEQNQQYQQITPLQMQTSNNNHYQQGQGATQQNIDASVPHQLPPSS